MPSDGRNIIHHKFHWPHMKEEAPELISAYAVFYSFNFH